MKKEKERSRPRYRNIDLNPQPFIQSRKCRPVVQEEDHKLPQIERTQSWELKEAQVDKPSREFIYNHLPDIITIPNSYFGLSMSQKRRRSFQSIVYHEKPFYPPGISSPTHDARKCNVPI